MIWSDLHDSRSDNHWDLNLLICDSRRPCTTRTGLKNGVQVTCIWEQNHCWTATLVCFFVSITNAFGWWLHVVALCSLSGSLVAQTVQRKRPGPGPLSGSLAPVPEVFIRTQPCARLINDASHEEAPSPSPPGPPVSFSLLLWNGQIEVTPKRPLCH